MKLKGVREFGDIKMLTISISLNEFAFIYDVVFEKTNLMSRMQSILTEDDKDRYKYLKLIVREMDECLKHYSES